eukprot:2174070-Rhodomonas_salina.6
MHTRFKQSKLTEGWRGCAGEVARLLSLRVCLASRRRRPPGAEAHCIAPTSLGLTSQVRPPAAASIQNMRPGSEKRHNAFSRTYAVPVSRLLRLSVSQLRALSRAALTFASLFQAGWLVYEFPAAPKWQSVSSSVNSHLDGVRAVRTDRDGVERKFRHRRSRALYVPIGLKQLLTCWQTGRGHSSNGSIRRERGKVRHRDKDDCAENRMRE